MPKVPLRLIAERVGCTRSTVSYALRDHPTISVSLREKIKEVARDLGWVPDAELQRQMALVRTTNTRKDLPNIAIVINRARVEFERLPTLGRHLEGAVRRAHELGFGTDLFSLSDEPLTEKRLEEIMHARGIKGVVLVDVDVTQDEKLLRVAEEFATVTVGVIPAKRVVHTVTADYMALGRRMMIELQKLGYRRPGVIIPRGVESLVQWSFTGGLHAGLGLCSTLEFIPFFYTKKPTIYVSQTEVQALNAWIDKHRPDCLVTLDTITVSSVARMRGGDMPRSLFSLDYHLDEGAVGGIDQNSLDTGVAGVDMVVSLLDRGQLGLPHIPRAVSVRESWIAPVAELRYSEFCDIRFEEMQRNAAAKSK
ncbi:MAG: LacI family DNA-binding transcriptional regulator [Opitutaceae bacterium]|nr:LacI family DNA-binding transcriptional regulator [Opitutaceae bacterium]